MTLAEQERAGHGGASGGRRPAQGGFARGACEVLSQNCKTSTHRYVASVVLGTSADFNWRVLFVWVVCVCMWDGMSCMLNI